MKKNMIRIISLFFMTTILCSFGLVFASTDLESKLTADDYSEEYEQWLQLSEEEKENTIQPRKYDIVTKSDNQTYLKGLNNVFKTQQLLRATITANYDLRDIIPENLAIRNQMQTNSCWAFATIGMLESHLALRDKNASEPTTIYDFSEKHMNYATARTAFLNNQINEYGFTKNISDGGNIYLAMQYMANGLGVVNESDVPFVNSEENIDIAEIKNKEVQATLYDTVEIPATHTSERAEVMPQIKEYITNYGGMYASIHGADLLGGNSYNNQTGAIYCESSLFEPADHTVVIIGWDDNYSKENFNEKQRPTEDGAWIIKNSWGDSTSAKLSIVKQNIFDAAVDGTFDSIDDITDEMILSGAQELYGEDKVSIQGEDLVVELGDKGYMYVSYEDCNVYKNLIGIEKATNTKDYENVYQNDTLGVSNNVTFYSDDTLSLANVFTRDTTEKEYLDKISIYTFQGYTCKVLVNPNGNSKAKEDLQEVQLTSGETETFEPGYHTIEFAEPVELTGNSFVVVVQIVTDDYMKEFALETPVADTMWQDAVFNAGESFYTAGESFDNNIWVDLATMEDETLRGNLCIKAYTTSEFQEEPDNPGTETPEEPDNPGTETPEEPDNPGTETPEEPDDPGTETPEEPENPEEKPEEKPENPVLSNFADVQTAITEAKLYFSSQDLSQVSSETTIKISGIKIGAESNTYTYYYHLSGTQGDKNITDWIKTEAVKQSDGTYTITLNITSEALQNYPEIAESDNLYVYIREVAEINQQSDEQIVTLEVDNQVEPECYIDGVMVGGIEDVLNYNNHNHSNSGNINQNRDNTVATGILPYAGGFTFKIIIAILIIAFGGFAYYRYKNIDR